jgi:hypothetical protein
MNAATVLVALVAAVAGAAQWGSRDGAMLIAAAFALGCIAGLDTALREHFSGRRDRTALLAATAAAVASAAGVFGGLGFGLSAMLALLAGGLALAGLRRGRALG